MKKLQPILVATLCILLLGACNAISKLSSNPFEQRYPITRCGGKVQVKDPDPTHVYGQYINPSKGIWLLTPYLTLRPPKFMNTDLDRDYITKMNGQLVDRIEEKFRRENWVEDIVSFPFQLVDEEPRDSVVNIMVSKAVKLDTVNYGNWNVPNELIRPDIPGYSLFLFIDGQVGFDSVTGNQNILYLFVIDNETRKTTYADYMRYECDVRNTNGLDKILDYAYLKLLTLRFPPEKETKS